MNMDIGTRTVEDSYVISINGECDASSSLQLDKALSEAIEGNQSKILIDCQQLEYISSAGIGVFTSVLAECKEKGIKIVLFSVDPKIFSVFKVLGLDQLLKIVDNFDLAKKYVDGM